MKPPQPPEQDLGVKVERIRKAWADGPLQRTHWEGCEFTHYGCAIRSLLSAYEERQRRTEEEIIILVRQLVMLNRGGTVENLADAIIEDIGYGAHRP